MRYNKCVYLQGGNCDIPHQIGEKVPNILYVWAALNLVDMS